MHDHATGSGDELFERALTHHRAGRLGEAEQLYRQILASNPDSPLVWSNLGGVLTALGRTDEALVAVHAALAINPAHAELHYNLAVLLAGAGDMVAAASSYQEALRRWPDFPQAIISYTGLLRAGAKFDEALSVAERAIEANPQLAVAHLERGRALHALARLQDAIAAYETCLRLQPDNAEAWEGLAIALNGARLYDAAIRACRQGLAAAGDTSGLYAAMAIALHALARGDEALTAHRRAVALDEHDAGEHSNLLYALNFQPDARPEEVFAEHLAWARRHAEPLTAVAPPPANDADPDRRLRVGYVSPYFCHHAVNQFSEPLITHHDHVQFEIHLYSTRGGPDDEGTTRLRAAADCWHDVATDSDERLAARVREDAIDILVDLTGHISGSRLLAFARKPAPVQVTYLGYQNTTGMSAMDYRLTDAWADPPGIADRLHTERLVRISPTFFCYRPPEDAPPLSELPALARGHLTFGSFNNLAKVNPLVLETWLELLALVPRSRLVVLGPSRSSLADRLHTMAAARGIEPGRVELADRRPQRDYLALMSEVDVALDTFPFNGHTTTCDSLWMGLPVVTLVGETYAARFGSSGLVQLGLHDWLATSVSDYLATVARQVDDVDRLAALRRELRPRMAASPLMDYPRFARQVEAAYRQMWRDWCRRRGGQS